MESLAPQYTDLPPVDVPAALPGPTLVLTDRADLAAAATALGAECRYADPLAGDEGGPGEEPRRHLGRHDMLVVAWGDGPAGQGTTDYATAVRFARAALALLHAVRASGRRVHLVTLSDERDVLPSLLDGMAASAALEMPLTHTAVVSDGPVTGEGLRAGVAAAARCPGARLRISGDRLARLRYVPWPPGDVPPAEVFGAGDRMVLVGGAGGVGRQVCRYLAERYGAEVFVLGRGTPGRDGLAALKAAGAKSYLAVPAHEPEAFEGALRYVREEFGPVKAVFNLAGVLDDCLLHNLTPDRLENVLRPKLAVGLNLAGLPEPLRPELVVHFSSLTSVTGNVGQVAYGAANAFLDRLTGPRTGWYSVNWGLWDTDGGGMRMPDDDASGLRALSARQACDTLMSALAAGARQTVVYEGRVRLDGGDGHGRVPPSAHAGDGGAVPGPPVPGPPVPGPPVPAGAPLPACVPVRRSGCGNSSSATAACGVCATTTTCWTWGWTVSAASVSAGRSRPGWASARPPG